MTTILLYHQEDRLLPWAAERTGGGTFRADAVALGWEQDGILRAVVVYDGFSEADCNMHIASDGSRRWLTRQFLAAAFAHPFQQWGLRRVTALVPADNEAALRFDEHLGFVREGYHPHALPDGDLVTLGLLKEHCKHLAPAPVTTEGA